jgi:hypothetical protein
MLTYAHVCSRMLAQEEERSSQPATPSTQMVVDMGFEMPDGGDDEEDDEDSKNARDEVRRMLTYAHVCSRMMKRTTRTRRTLAMRCLRVDGCSRMLTYAEVC